MPTGTSKRNTPVNKGLQNSSNHNESIISSDHHNTLQFANTHCSSKSPTAKMQSNHLQNDCAGTPQQQTASPSSSTPLQETNFTDSPCNSQASGDTAKARSGSLSRSTAIQEEDEEFSNQAEETSIFTSLPQRISKELSYTKAPATYTTPTATLRSSKRPSASPASPTKSQGISSPASSRFSFFTSRMSALKALASSPAAAQQDDELLNLDIDAALFPPGVLPEGDAFSLAAYKNLQMTATGLLHRYQTAYRSRTSAFQQMQAERDAIVEEKAEMDTRAQHLKFQLEEMARQAAATESAMLSLMDELNREKRLRMEERSARKSKPAPSVVSTVSEDLGAEEDQQKKLWRRSGETYRTDASSDDESESIEASSVFSRSRSPTLAASICDVSPVEAPTLPSSRAPFLEPATTLGKHQLSQMTTFQKLFKGISGDPTNEGMLQAAMTACSNCQGQDASVAWDTASLMRDENRGLKHRVTELESALEGALDIVNGVGL